MKGKEYFDISGSDVAILSVSPAKQKGNLTASIENGQLKLAYKGTGTAKYTLSVQNKAKWTQPIKITGKVSKVNVSKLALKASKTKVTINTNYPEIVTVGISVKGNSSLPVELSSICSPNTDALLIDTDSETKTIKIHLDPNKTIAARKYTVTVEGKIGENKIKKTKVTITVTDKKPTVKLSAKGSINVANREASGITYTASIKNTDAVIAKAVITNENALYYKVHMEDEKKFSIKALPNVPITAGKKSQIKLRIVLSNGYVLADDIAVTIKPVSKLPNIKVSATKGTIDKNGADVLPVRLAYDKGVTISDVRFTGKNSENFIITRKDEHLLNIRLSDKGANLRKGKYTLKYEMSISGTDNKKKVTKSIKITVK